MSGEPVPGGGLPRRWWRMRSRSAARNPGGYGCGPAEGQLAGQCAVDAGPADRILEEGRVIVQVDGVEVLVVRTRRGVFAVENLCPHAGRHLTDAAVSGSRVTCAGHHRRYDLASGRPVTRAVVPGAGIRVFDAWIAGGRLWLAPGFHGGSGRPGAVARVPGAPPRSREGR
jgi:nitrite reductase/ring-hydroxylating ferredoxin subunit